ncbi:MAG TPA: GNAT family N-acetyltransferase [Thermoanaerobaculia bacterium]|nr:GNAT family N-acetyltransferase [Thermoanaerobaculia bacterium]
MDSRIRSTGFPALSAPAARASGVEPGETSLLSPWRVERLSTTEALEPMREEWSTLLRTSWSDGLFLTWEWLYTWWKHCRPDDGELAVYAVRYGCDLLGLAPFLVGPSRSCPPIAASAFQFLGGGSVGSDYLDLVVRPARRVQTVAALAATLDAGRRVVDLVQVRREQSSAQALAELLERRGWRTLRRTTHCCPYISLEGHTFESYLESLGPSHRYNFRRRLRQLERGFELRFDRVRTEEERREALEILLRLHHGRFAQRGGSDAFHTPELIAFHRELSALALERGWLRLFVLRLDGRPAAALYGFRYQDRFLFYQAGFDSAFTRHSVGLVTMGLAIRAAIEEGIREYDLLHGDEPYKSLWASSRRELERIELFPPTAGGVLHRLLRRAARIARRTLPRPAGDGAPSRLTPKRETARCCGER